MLLFGVGMVGAIPSQQCRLLDSLPFFNSPARSAQVTNISAGFICHMQYSSVKLSMFRTEYKSVHIIKKKLLTRGGSTEGLLDNRGDGNNCVVKYFVTIEFLTSRNKKFNNLSTEKSIYIAIFQVENGKMS